VFSAGTEPRITLYRDRADVSIECVLSYSTMCSLTLECVLLLYNVFSYYRMCSLTVCGCVCAVYCSGHLAGREIELCVCTVRFLLPDEYSFFKNQMRKKGGGKHKKGTKNA